MVRLHVLIYLVFFVIAICNYEFEKKRERYKYEYDQNISKTQRKLTYLFEILIDFQYAKEMRINQASKWASDKIDKEVKEYNQKLSAHTKKLCQLNFFETVLLAIINAVSYGYVVYLAYNGSISIGQMTMYIGTMLAFAQAVGGLLASVSRLNMFSVYVKDYETYLENVTSSNKSLLAQTSSQKEGSYDIEFVETLDNGLDTLYSKEFDKNGVELSGGESQKLAIARACYKDAPIIILDEPTASLDAVAEYEIYAGFEKLVENKTAIIISHRLSSTHFCDRIIVINNGTVFEDGTHQSLMAKESGIYKKMFTTQAAHYFSDPTTVAVVD